MSLYDYHVFNTVVQQGSFNKASRVLHVTPSAVSHIIAKLEEDFGFPLLYRNRTGISLTPDGQKMLPSIQEALQLNEQLDQEIAELNGLSGGVISIAAFASVALNWLPGIVRDFKENHPNVIVRVYQGSYGEVAAWIDTGACDLAFVTGTYNAPSEIELIKLHTESLVCAMPRNKRTKNNNNIHIDELAGEVLIQSLSGTENEASLYMDRHGLKSLFEYNFDDDKAKLAMVAAGLGVCILPELSARSSVEEIKTLPLVPEAHRDIYLAITHSKFMAPATEEMKTHIIEYVGFQK